jgi:hypothetical protein
MLFSYWDGLRGERAAPERSDVIPGAIRHVLADTFVLGVEGGGPPTFRLAGTRCCALFGRDLKDLPIASLWPADKADEINRQLDMVLSETAGLVAGLTGSAENGWSVDLEILLLPLRHRGSTHARALGAISPVHVPSWIGLIPIVSLETKTLRVVNSGRERRPEQPVQRVQPVARRPKLVVHEGGRI